MNITFVSNVTTKEKAFGYLPQLENHNVKFFTMSDSDEKIALGAKDTQILIVDAMASISDALITSLPKLELIQSEGVGYQGVDIKAAKEHDVIVCNNKGINDTAVAEVAVFLILGCLKSINTGQQAVYDGRQMEVKKASFGVVRELSECTVGLVGLGDIAKATAKLLKAFGARVVYSNRTRYEDFEKKFDIEYMELDDLLKISDFVSLHLAVCDDTRNIVDEEFLSKMKKGAYLINTSRGDLVDNHALLHALLTDKIAGAGLDVIYPEPVEKDNILLDNRIKDKLLLTPHIAGITSLTVKKIYENAYENILRLIKGEQLLNIVN